MLLTTFRFLLVLCQKISLRGLFFFIFQLWDRYFMLSFIDFVHMISDAMI